MKTAPNENSLLQGLANNNRKAVETIYKENYNMVQSLIINNNGTIDDARDIFQEAMIILYEKVKSGTLELNCQLKTYVYSVSRRLWLKRLMHQNKFILARDNELVIAEADDDVKEYERRNRELNIMEKALNSVGEPCKSLLEGFYMQKKTMQEIATSFGYTNADNAKNQKYKCLMRLKKLFFTQYKNEE
ncbi:MAG: RNA polymerase sigma factor [Chitinophagaceae bacterium]